MIQFFDNAGIGSNETDRYETSARVAKRQCIRDTTC